MGQLELPQRPRAFVVQRSKWLRGLNRDTWLVDDQGRMCCLGFVSAQCGVSPSAMVRVGAPNGLRWAEGKPLLGLLLVDLRCHTELAAEAVRLNDATMDDAEREAQLTALFAAHGYTLRFEP